MVRFRTIRAALCTAAVSVVVAGCQSTPRIYHPHRHATVRDPLFEKDVAPPPKPPKPLPPKLETPSVRVRNSPWKFIIVHHSATDFGNAEQFNKLHKQRGWKGVGYHFVIGNGTRGTADGQIEATFRWTQQIPGAHCKAGGMNEQAIGICLVGDFSQHAPSRAQIRSLIRLLRVLQQTFGIPASHIAGHGEVRGANTKCPGKYLPWRTIRANLVDISTAQ